MSKRNNGAKLELVKEEEVMENHEVEVAETATVKKTWSLKKKLIAAGVGLGVLGLGAIALVLKNKNNEDAEDSDDYSAALEIAEAMDAEDSEETTDTTQTTEF